MITERSKPPTRMSEQLAHRLSELYGPCIGCEDCYGFCPALIEALMVPDAILNRKPDPQ